MEESVLLAALAIVASCVGGLIWLVKEQNKQNNSTLKDNTKATNGLTSTLTNINATLAASHKTDQENQKSNNNFREVVLKYLSDIDAKTDRNFEAVKSIKIEEQLVEHQTVIKQETPKI